MSDAIRNTFNKLSADYDLQRRKFIPCFDDFYEISTSILDIDEANPRVLDIGAGTGLFSSYVLKRFPDAQLTLVDISEGMLEVAKLRFIDHPNIRFITGDYSRHTFDEKYNVIISALSIHHLTDTEKEYFYKKCFMLLEEQGY